MKLNGLFIFAALLVFGCGTKPIAPEDDKKPEPMEWRSTYNGELLLGMAGAYDSWEQTGKLSTVIKWEGVTVFNGEYARAGLSLFVKMLDEPDTWMKEDVEYPSATVTFVKDDPFLPRMIPFSAFEKVARQAYESMCNDGELGGRYFLEPYNAPFTNTAINVMLCRAFAYFRDNSRFPDTIDAWDSSYLNSTTNCNIDAPEVKAARDEAWAAAGVTENSSTMDKVVAIFNYTRDVWEYEDYYNTKKGAVGTIDAKAGNCCDMSHGIVAMARLSGIPARYFHAQCTFSSGVIGHVVSQVMIDDQWYMADATNNNNTFGNVRFTDYFSDEILEDLPW